MNFRETNVIITGGSSGIGKDTAKLLARYGANVFIIARDKSKLDRALIEIEEGCVSLNQQFDAFSTDVKNNEEIKATISEIVERSGPPDILINSAGVSQPGYFENIPLSVFEEEMNTNYLGTLYTIKAVLPHMKANRGGYIVNVSSVAGFIGGFGYGSYAPSKFAVCGLSEVLRNELKSYNIQVSVLFPFDTDTPMLREGNKSKPLETKIITGAIKPEKISGLSELLAYWLLKLFIGRYKPMSSEEAAKSLIEGIQRRDYLIIPDSGMKALYYLKGFLTPLMDWVFDKMVNLAQKEQAVIPATRVLSETFLQKGAP